MTEVKHTAGPWKVSKANPHRVIVAEGDKVGLAIAEANHFVGGYRDISLANARLIAAAPDALEFAHWVSDATDEELIRLARKKSRVVIAKAEART